MSNYYPPNDQNTNKVWEKIENPETAGWDGEKLQKLLLYLGRKSTSNFIILHNGKIVCEKRWELSRSNMSANQEEILEKLQIEFADLNKKVTDVYSVDKSCIALLIGIADDKQLINLHSDIISKYAGIGWSNAKEEEETKIKIKHLLSMTSGLTEFLTQPQLQYECAPEKKWKYNTAAYMIGLQAVLRKAFDNNELKDIYKNELLNKIGCSKESTLIKRKFSTFPDDIPMYGLNISCRDMARIGLLTLRHGIWKDEKKIINPITLKQILTSSQELNPAYGFGFWLNGKPFVRPALSFTPNAKPIGLSLMDEVPDDMFAAMGSNANCIFVIPSLNLVVARQGMHPDEDEANFNNEMCRKLLEASPFSLDKKRESLKNAKL